MSNTSAPSFVTGEQSPVVTLGHEDAGEVLTLQRAAYITEVAAHDDFALPPLTQTLGELQTELSAPEVTALGIRDHGRLIAALRLCRSGPVIELRRLTVVPDRQGEGIGTRLLRHAEAVFPEAQEMRLFTGERSTANIRLYTRHGYREFGRTPAGDYQLVHLVKSLR